MITKLLRTFLQEDGSRRYQVWVPDFIADREDYPHYEKDRFLSMEMNLHQGDVLFDIGTETGWQSAIYARFVGGENMCLFEHVAELWPTIKQIWEANDLPRPKATYCGFVSNREAFSPHFWQGLWPVEACGSPLTDETTWSVIHSSTVGPELMIDQFVKSSGVIPRALTIDVEGAEFRVLSGAHETLLEHRPLVWVSLHPELRMKTYHKSKQAVRDFIKDCGYERQYLGVDHEEHDFCYPKELAGKVVLVDSPWMTHATRHESFEEKILGWKDTEGMPYAKQWGSDD